MAVQTALVGTTARLPSCFRRRCPAGCRSTRRQSPHSSRHPFGRCSAPLQDYKFCSILEQITTDFDAPLSRLFISHSSRNDDWALALQAWLIREGWSGEQDIFLDLDPERGIVAGQRWARALEDAATRCEAVLFFVSEIWLASKWCGDEYQLASRLNKKLFALLNRRHTARSPARRAHGAMAGGAPQGRAG
jgi:hypothetical protein